MVRAGKDKRPLLPDPLPYLLCVGRQSARGVAYVGIGDVANRYGPLSWSTFKDFLLGWFL